MSIHNNIELNKEKRVLLSPKKILSTKYLIFNDINNIEQLNDLKLIEDVQHDLKINKKDKNNDKDKATTTDIPKDLVNFNQEILKSEIITDKKLLIQVG